MPKPVDITSFNGELYSVVSDLRISIQSVGPIMANRLEHGVTLYLPRIVRFLVLFEGPLILWILFQGRQHIKLFQLAQLTCLYV